MGTRADFYVGNTKEAEWLGSIGYDGYPTEDKEGITTATTEEGFREAVSLYLTSVDHATQVSEGWPWPWEDSRTTDYAYMFNAGKVEIYGFGRLIDGSEEDEEGENFDYEDWKLSHPKLDIFPNMKHVQNVSFGKNSGLLVLGLKN